MIDGTSGDEELDLAPILESLSEVINHTSVTNNETRNMMLASGISLASVIYEAMMVMRFNTDGQLRDELDKNIETVSKLKSRLELELKALNSQAANT